jgi:hypothetical protein
VQVSRIGGVGGRVWSELSQSQSHPSYPDDDEGWGPKVVVHRGGGGGVGSHIRSVSIRRLTALFIVGLDSRDILW